MAVFRADPPRLAVQFDGTVEDAQHALRWQRDVTLERRAQLRVIVDDREDAESAAVGQGVREKFHRPAVAERLGSRRAAVPRPARAVDRPNRQSA